VRTPKRCKSAQNRYSQAGSLPGPGAHSDNLMSSLVAMPCFRLGW
jgi:hypothetical protein